jgi:hypothetical protein
MDDEALGVRGSRQLHKLSRANPPDSLGSRRGDQLLQKILILILILGVFSLPPIAISNLTLQTLTFNPILMVLSNLTLQTSTFNPILLPVLIAMLSALALTETRGTIPTKTWSIEEKSALPLCAVLAERWCPSGKSIIAPTTAWLS